MAFETLVQLANELIDDALRGGSLADEYGGPRDLALRVLAWSEAEPLRFFAMPFAQQDRLFSSAVSLADARKDEPETFCAAVRLAMRVLHANGGHEDGFRHLREASMVLAHAVADPDLPWGVRTAAIGAFRRAGARRSFVLRGQTAVFDVLGAVQRLLNARPELSADHAFVLQTCRLAAHCAREYRGVGEVLAVVAVVAAKVASGAAPRSLEAHAALLRTVSELADGLAAPFAPIFSKWIFRRRDLRVLSFARSCSASELPRLPPELRGFDVECTAQLWRAQLFSLPVPDAVLDELRGLAADVLGAVPPRRQPPQRALVLALLAGESGLSQHGGWRFFVAQLGGGFAGYLQPEIMLRLLPVRPRRRLPPVGTPVARVS